MKISAFFCLCSLALGSPVQEKVELDSAGLILPPLHRSARQVEETDPQGRQQQRPEDLFEEPAEGEPPANQDDPAQAPGDEAVPAEGDAPADGAVPADGDVPADGAPPAEGDIPADGAVPADDVPVDGAPPAEGDIPAEDPSVAAEEAVDQPAEGDTGDPAVGDIGQDVSPDGAEAPVEPAEVSPEAAPAEEPGVVAEEAAQPGEGIDTAAVETSPDTPVDSRPQIRPPDSVVSTKDDPISIYKTTLRQPVVDETRVPEALKEARCNFLDGREDKTLCSWTNFNLTNEKWVASMGENALWTGGPSKDVTASNERGGYALYETSKLVDAQAPQPLVFDSAMMLSPLLRRTRAKGNCVDFWYAMDGLSQERLRILLRPPPPNFPRHALLNETMLALYQVLTLSDGRDDIVLWENRDPTGGNFVNGQVVYAYNDMHVLIFEGIPQSASDSNRAYRGYIAVDGIEFPDADDCKPFCNFEGGLCSWIQDEDDDFDWSQSRGSIDPSTGPPMDRFSFNYGIKGGGYAYIDSGYPQRVGERARLMSEVFSPPGADLPLCMRFWTHMYGNGIGALRVLLKSSSEDDKVIWELEGEQGNNWYQAQVTITSEVDFQIVFEAEVGENGLGDIAIDEISIKENACPTSPQSASKIYGDCTFEVDECGWSNVERRELVDEFDWERTQAAKARAPLKDHTLKSTQGSYMTLPRTTVQRGERAWLASSIIPPTQMPMCISFWYFMYDPFIEQSGPSLGALRVLMMEEDSQGLQLIKPLWELKNHQGPNWMYGQTSISSNNNFMVLFEGLWGNSRGSEYIAIDDVTFFMGECTTKPEKATSNILDCDFTRSSCSYMNSTSGSTERWVPAGISRKPAFLTDHTFGGPVGYIYFDVFNTNTNQVPEVRLMSRVVERQERRDGTDEGRSCLTFWFAPIGGDQQTRLRIEREVVDSTSNSNEGQTRDPLTIWEVRASDHYVDRIEWMFGQVDLQTETDYKISIVGTARKGGFALDDVKVFPGTCRTRPEPREDTFDDDTRRTG